MCCEQNCWRVFVVSVRTSYRHNLGMYIVLDKAQHTASPNAHLLYTTSNLRSPFSCSDCNYVLALRTLYEVRLVQLTQAKRKSTLSTSRTHIARSIPCRIQWQEPDPTLLLSERSLVCWPVCHTSHCNSRISSEPWAQAILGSCRGPTSGSSGRTARPQCCLDVCVSV